MDMFSDIKAVMNDLKQRQIVLKKELEDFQELQNEINQLVVRSSNDPDAMAKLIKLNNAFPQGFEVDQEKIMTKINEVESHFKMLVEQLNILDEIDSTQNSGNELVSQTDEKPLIKVNHVKAKKIRSYL